MATPGDGKKGKKSQPQTSQQPSKSAEKYFGSEVDLKVINPPQKLTDDEKLPQPPDLSQKPGKDATNEDSLKELTAKLQNLGKT